MSTRRRPFTLRGAVEWSSLTSDAIPPPRGVPNMTEYECALAAAGIPHDPWMGGYDRLPSILRVESDPAALVSFFVANPHASKDPRERFVERFGWAIPSDHALDVLGDLGPILEVGAGSGYWAWELRARGVDIVATDLRPGPDHPAFYPTSCVWTDIEALAAVDAVRRYAGRALFLCWPCYREPWAAEALDAFQGDRVAYIGEVGGCTADDRFHDLLRERYRLEQTVKIPQWSGLHDALRVYRRDRA